MNKKTETWWKKTNPMNTTKNPSKMQYNSIKTL